MALGGFTIDGETSKDLDDAVWATRLKGTIRVQIFIADVAKAIEIDSHLDRRAQERVESKYRPGHIVPMLPVSLSEDRLSLLYNEQRSVIMVQFDVDAQGEILKTTVRPETFTSWAQLSYEKADSILNDNSHELHEPMKLLQEVTARLNQHRRSQGAVFGQQFGNVWIDESGKAISQPFHSQMMISELMITANQIVADILAHHKAPAPYRTHAYRSGTNDALVAFLKQLGDISTLQSVLVDAFDRAQYSTLPEGHAGLQLAHYCHFTSPIRRYVDLVVHRIIRAVMLKQPLPYTTKQLHELCVTINAHKDKERLQIKEIKKEQANQQAVQLLHQEPLPELNEKQFSAVIKTAVRNHSVDMIEAEVVQRAKESRLNENDLYYLLMGLTAWEDLKLRVLSLNQENPRLLSVLAISSNKSDTIKQCVIKEGSLQSPDNQFPCRYTALIDGMTMTTYEWATGANKRESKQRAAYLWLDAYISGELVRAEDAAAEPTTPEKVSSAPPQTVEENAINYVGGLNEIAQQNQLALPVYEFAELRTQWFRCTCQFWSREGQGEAASKKEAKRLAAMDLMQKLEAGKQNYP